MAWGFPPINLPNWLNPPAPVPAGAVAPSAGSGTGTGTATTFRQLQPVSSGEGNPFYTGSVGTVPGKGHTGPVLPGLNTGIDFKAIADAIAKQKGEVKDIFGRTLGVGSGKFGALESVLAGLLQNPWGFNEADLTKARTRISEREAGMRQGAFQRLSEGAGGFKGGRVLDKTLRESMRGQSSQRITDAELALDMANQTMKQQNFMAAIQAALGTAGISAGLVGQEADIFANAFAPVPVAGQEGPGSSQLPLERGLKENRLPGESLADQLRREAGAWSVYYGGGAFPAQ
jgi:hypothetical protein